MAVDKCRFQETFCSSKDYNEVQPESRQVSDPLHANDETFRIKNVEKIDNFRIFLVLKSRLFFLVLKSKKKIISSIYIRAGKFRNIFPYYDSKITYCVCSVCNSNQSSRFHFHNLTWPHLY